LLAYANGTVRGQIYDIDATLASDSRRRSDSAAI